MKSAPECEKSVLPTVLVIDSGVGGLSDCQAMLQHGPTYNFVYIADDALFPYGLLEEEKLSERLIALIDRLLPLHQPDLVVLACNTVSTLVLPILRERYQVPFVGVVPAIKPASKISESRCIGLLATPATVRRPYTDQLIQDFASDCVVVRVGSNDLVIEAERLFSGQSVSEDVLFETLKPFMVAHDGRRVDTVVLGCTHFPLISEHIQRLMPGVSLVDSGSAIARRVADLLAVRADPKARAKQTHLTFYFTGRLPDVDVFKHSLKAMGFCEVVIKLLT